MEEVTFYIGIKISVTFNLCLSISNANIGEREDVHIQNAV